MSKKIEWSSYQKEIFKQTHLGERNLFISARAGASKTTVLIESIKYIPRSHKVLMLAFNKIIAEELTTKVGSYVDIYTLHSLGYKAIRNNNPNIKLDKNKMFKIIQDLMPEKIKKSNSSIAFTLETCRAISLCKGYLIDSPSQIDELLDKFSIHSSLEREEYIEFIIQCLKICKEKKDIIDYDDMIYFPFIFNLNVGKYDNVIVDEAQDLNLPQLFMALSAMKKNGRISFFFDEYQDLYSWRASNVDGLKKIQNNLNGLSLLLPISYRCDKQIIKLAQSIVPDIQYRKDAGEGWIIRKSEDDLFKMVRSGDFVISRTNAPLIKYALYCLRNNISAHIQGKSLSAPFLLLINKSKATTVSKFLEWLKKWKDSESKRLIAKNRPIDPIIDTYESLEFFCEKQTSLEEVKKNIKAVCDSKKDNEQITFSTVHAAKGLERKRVFLLMRTFKVGKNKEENNIYYTAITRAKEELYLLY